MKISLFVEHSMILVYPATAQQTCALIDLMNELQPKLHMWIDEVLVIEVRTLGKYVEMFDCLELVRIGLRAA